MYKTGSAIVIENLKSFFEKNNYNVIKTTENKTYIRFDCNKENMPTMAAIVVLTDDDVVKKSPEMEDLIGTIKEDGIIIVPVDISSGVKKKVESLVKKSTYHLAVHHYKIFSINMLERKNSPVHKIMSKSDEKILFNDDLCVSKNQLPKIKLNDPKVIWICARVGDVIHIKRPSETSIFEDVYRVVVPGDVTIDD